MKRNIIITGGAGFIGSHVVRLFVNKYPEYNIINLDKLTYAGNLANLKDIEDKANYTFVKADICDYDTILQLMQQYKVDGINGLTSALQHFRGGDTTTITVWRAGAELVLNITMDEKPAPDAAG